MEAYMLELNSAIDEYKLGWKQVRYRLEEYNTLRAARTRNIVALDVRMQERDCAINIKNIEISLRVLEARRVTLAAEIVALNIAIAVQAQSPPR